LIESRSREDLQTFIDSLTAHDAALAISRLTEPEQKQVLALLDPGKAADLVEQLSDVQAAMSPRRGESTAPSPAGALPAPSETMARLGHAAGADAPAGSALGVLRQDAALSFEVTLNDPRGIGLELRAQRTGGSQVGAAPAPWSLTVGSGLVDASVLARHAPRLNDRLLARVVTHGHVRIEGHAGANERDGDRGREGSA
jgi:hypothetical protein